MVEEEEEEEEEDEVEEEEEEEDGGWRTEGVLSPLVVVFEAEVVGVVGARRSRNARLSWAVAEFGRRPPHSQMRRRSESRVEGWNGEEEEEDDDDEDLRCLWVV